MPTVDVRGIIDWELVELRRTLLGEIGSPSVLGIRRCLFGPICGEILFWLPVREGSAAVNEDVFGAFGRCLIARIFWEERRSAVQWRG